VADEPIAKIGFGLCVFLGIHRNDTEAAADRLIAKVSALRIFSDNNGKMNLSVRDVGGEILCVSEFTLYGDTTSGNRPSYANAAGADLAKALYEQVRGGLAAEGGAFGEHMTVELANDGPVTVLIEC
jgi:D-aminoacyl-tRNA deacylase